MKVKRKVNALNEQNAVPISPKKTRSSFDSPNRFD